MTDLLRALDGDANADDLAGVVALLRTHAHGPNALERLAALSVWKRAYEAQHPASRNGGDRKSGAYRRRNQNADAAFWSVAAAALGLAARSVQTDIKIAIDLGVRDIKRLWGGQIADNQAALRTVAELDEIHREALFAVWGDNPKLSFNTALIAACVRAKKDSREEQARKGRDWWSRSGSASRRDVLLWIGVPEEVADTVVASWRKRGKRS